MDEKPSGADPDEQLPGPAERYAQLNAIHRVLIQEGGYVAIGLDHDALPSDAMARAAVARRLKRSDQGYTTDAAPALIGFGASSIGSLPQGYVQNAPTAAAYAKEIEAGRLATVRGVALTGKTGCGATSSSGSCATSMSISGRSRQSTAPIWRRSKKAASEGPGQVHRGRPRLMGRGGGLWSANAGGRSSARSRRCSTPIWRRRPTSLATRARCEGPRAGSGGIAPAP